MQSCRQSKWKPLREVRLRRVDSQVAGLEAVAQAVPEEEATHPLEGVPDWGATNPRSAT